jgi:paraquat-inducible protein B
MTEPESVPVATLRPARRFSTTWLIPLAALVFIAVLLVTHLARARGPVITIRFDDAAGLAPGAEIVHRGLAVGVVRELRPTDTLDAVLATAELTPEAAQLAVDGTDFWIVRPEVSLDRIAGLETLIGPRYIAVRPGPSAGPPRRAFEGLDTPPRLTPAADGSVRITLRSPRLGSVAPGSPVFYREIPVGAVRAADLAPDATGVLIALDIHPAYAPLVRDNSRFWRAGGLGVDFGLFRGLSVQAESLDQLITSGIAFATPNRPGNPPSPAQTFDLADTPDGDWLEWTPSIPLPE